MFKVLRLDQAVVSSTAAGQVANLMSNDVARFDLVPVYLHGIWIMPIQVMTYDIWLKNLFYEPIQKIIPCVWPRFNLPSTHGVISVVIVKCTQDENNLFAYYRWY